MLDYNLNLKSNFDAKSAFKLGSDLAKKGENLLDPKMPRILRYPLAAIDKSQDMLLIRIYNQVNNPIGIDPSGPQDTVPFHPYYTIKDFFGLSVFLTLFAAAIFFFPNFMGHPDNYIPANPMQTPAHIVPEWYFLPFYAILRAVPDKLGGVLAMFGAIAVLFILPWLDRSPIRSGNFRPIFKIFFWVFFADCIALGYLGGMPAEGIYVVLSRVATAWYFLHFLVILPLLSVIETPKPLPQSLSKSVLGGSAMVGAASAVKEKV